MGGRGSGRNAVPMNAMLKAKAMNMTSYLLNTKTNRRFEIIKLDKDKNLLTLRGETGGVFEEPYDKARLKSLGYIYKQKDADDA